MGAAARSCTTFPITQIRVNIPALAAVSRRKPAEGQSAPASAWSLAWHGHALMPGSRGAERGFPSSSELVRAEEASGRRQQPSASPAEAAAGRPGRHAAAATSRREAGLGSTA